MQKQLLLSSRLSHCNSVRPTVHLSVIQVDQSKVNHQIFTVGCLEGSSFRNRKTFP